MDLTGCRDRMTVTLGSLVQARNVYDYKVRKFSPRFGIKELRLKSRVFISLVFIYLNLNLRLFNYLLNSSIY